MALKYKWGRMNKYQVLFFYQKKKKEEKICDKLVYKNSDKIFFS